MMIGYCRLELIMMTIVTLLKTNISFRTVPRLNSCKYFRKSSMSMQSELDTQDAIKLHESYLKDTARVNPPLRLNTLLKLLHKRGDKLMDPSNRKGLIPFLVPVSLQSDNSLLCYIRWPTQKDDMDLQLVTTTEAGVKLVSLGTDQLCRRIVAESCHNADKDYSENLQTLKESGLVFDENEYLTFLKSGKFPILTEEDRKLTLDRYILTKIGAFPDCYERMAMNFLKKGSDVSALVTCERAVSVFYGWGHPVKFHAFILNLEGRDKEARDTARSTMGSPKWTIANNNDELLEITRLAGFSELKLVGDLHAFRSSDPRTKDIEEGVSPIQVTLDQAGHLMDAVALGSVEGGWDGIRTSLASKYRDGGYPEIADFILS